MNNINILYVDDDAREFEPLARSIMKMVGLDDLPSKIESEGSIEYQLIKTNLKYTIVCVEDKDSALYYIKQKKIDIVFIDYHLRNEVVGTEVGLEISEAVHYNPDYSAIYLVMLTAYNESIIDTLRSGLFKDFLTKNQLNNLSDIQGIFARFEAFRESERKRIEAEKRAEKAEKSEREMYSTLRELQVGFNVNIDSFTDKNSLLNQ
jgi:CheY-like chemotaxis protein